MICRGLTVYFATFFSRKTIIALDPNWLNFCHLTTEGCPYLRKLESLIVCRCLYKGSTFCSALKDPRLSVDPAGVLNQRPLAQQTGAYPAELTGRQKMTSHES